MVVEVTVVQRQDPPAVERLLRSLPEWFGIEESLVGYVRDAEVRPTYLALDPEGEVVGALVVSRHFPGAAEMSLLVVDRLHHGQGVGRLLVDRFEADMKADGVRFVQVKTLGPSRPDERYAATLRFYRAMGYEPLEELSDHWPGNPCLILVKSLADHPSRPEAGEGSSGPYRVATQPT